MREILLVVDPQNDFINGVFGSKAAADTAGRIAKVLYDNLSKRRYSDVIYTMDTHKADEYEYSLESMKYKPHCIVNTKGWDVENSIASALQKNHARRIEKGAFGCTELCDFLVAHFVDELSNGAVMIDIAGFATDVCVVSTALLLRSAFEDLPITVNSALCAGTSAEMHAKALDVMESCNIETFRSF